jgi:hypothetical protein
MFVCLLDNSVKWAAAVGRVSHLVVYLVVLYVVVSAYGSSIQMTLFLLNAFFNFEICYVNNIVNVWPSVIIIIIIESCLI